MRKVICFLIWSPNKQYLFLCFSIFYFVFSLSSSLSFEEREKNKEKKSHVAALQLRWGFLFHFLMTYVSVEIGVYGSDFDKR